VTRVQLWQTFRLSLQPITLALVLSSILALWKMKNGMKGNQILDVQDYSDRLHPPALQRLQECISNPTAFSEDYVLLKCMFEAVYNALDKFDEKASEPLKRFLRRAAQRHHKFWDEELSRYFVARLAGNSHDGATETRY